MAVLCASCMCVEPSVYLAGLWRHTWLLALREKGSMNQLHPAQRSHQLLYCRVGIGFHIQVLTNGSVCGVHEPTEYSFVKIFAMRPGVVAIRGVKSQMFLCMNKDGIAQGMKRFSNDCLFKERVEENHYNTYSSLLRPSHFLALSQQGRPRRGNRVGRHQACTHFLPRKHIVLT